MGSRVASLDRTLLSDKKMETAAGFLPERAPDPPGAHLASPAFARIRGPRLPSVRSRPQSGRFDLPDLKPALLLQLNSHPFCAIQQSPEMIASKRVVGMQADKRRESLHRRAVAALELDESLAILRVGRGRKRVCG